MSNDHIEGQNARDVSMQNGTAIEAAATLLLSDLLAGGRVGAEPNRPR